jgi:hypothetical protein
MSGKGSRKKNSIIDVFMDKLVATAFDCSGEKAIGWKEKLEDLILCSLIANDCNEEKLEEKREQTRKAFIFIGLHKAQALMGLGMKLKNLSAETNFLSAEIIDSVFSIQDKLGISAYEIKAAFNLVMPRIKNKTAREGLIKKMETIIARSKLAEQQSGGTYFGFSNVFTSDEDFFGRRD